MTYRPTSVASREAVVVRDWSAHLLTGDVVTVETGVAGTVEAEVIGFSKLDDYYGQPAIETPDVVREQLDEAGRADQVPDVLALREEDLLEEELVTDGGRDVDLNGECPVCGNRTLWRGECARQDCPGPESRRAAFDGGQPLTANVRGETLKREVCPVCWERGVVPVWEPVRGFLRCRECGADQNSQSWPDGYDYCEWRRRSLSRQRLHVPVTDGGETISTRLRTIATDLDDVEADLRQKGRYEWSLASVVGQMADVSRKLADRLEDRQSAGDLYRLDDDELLTDGGAVTSGDQHLCHACGRLHDGRGAALECCSEKFEDSELVTDGGSEYVCPIHSLALELRKRPTRYFCPACEDVWSQFQVEAPMGERPLRERFLSLIVDEEES